MIYDKLYLRRDEIKKSYDRGYGKDHSSDEVTTYIKSMASYMTPATRAYRAYTKYGYRIPDYFVNCAESPAYAIWHNEYGSEKQFVPGGVSGPGKSHFAKTAPRHSPHFVMVRDIFRFRKWPVPHLAYLTYAVQVEKLYGRAYLQAAKIEMSKIYDGLTVLPIRNLYQGVREDEKEARGEEWGAKHLIRDSNELVLVSTSYIDYWNAVGLLLQLWLLFHNKQDLEDEARIQGELRMYSFTSLPGESLKELFWYFVLTKDKNFMQWVLGTIEEYCKLYNTTESLNVNVSEMSTLMRLFLPNDFPKSVWKKFESFM